MEKRDYSEMAARIAELNEVEREREINKRIDQIQQDCDRISAEARNTLHACRKDHPLGRGKDRTDLFRNAAFVLGGRMCPYAHIIWLNQVANQFHEERSA